MKACPRRWVSSFWLGGKSVSAGNPCRLSPGHGCLPHTQSHPELEIQRDTCDWRPKVCPVVFLWLGTWGLGTPHSAMLHRYHGLYKLEVCSNPGLTKSAPFFQQSAYFVSMCHVSLWIFSTFTLLYLLWYSMISDLWCHCYNTLKVQMMASNFFSSKVSFNWSMDIGF